MGLGSQTRKYAFGDPESAHEFRVMGKMPVLR